MDSAGTGLASEEDYLLLSGLQHYAFCPRQWALIHVEQQWEEDASTIGGSAMHARCHDAYLSERRGDKLVVRGLNVTSHRLKVRGVCDVVEFVPSDEGVALRNEAGLWFPFPVEYKYGKPKIGQEDEVQVCAQAMALEEMFGLNLDEAYVYYGRRHRRHLVSLDNALRDKTVDISRRMHADFERGCTPPAKRRACCDRCSLNNLCLPEASSGVSVLNYIESLLGGEQ